MTEQAPDTSPKDVILSARGIVKEYSDGESFVRVLSGVDLEVERGKCIVIMGRSGAGKSTLLHILGLVDSPTEGEVVLEGNVVSAPERSTAGRALRKGLASRAWRNRRAHIRNRKFGFVFQAYHLIEELSALENCLLPAMMVGPFQWRRRRKAALERAKMLLTEVGLADRMNARPSRLSGGERQRVAIARALINEPQVLFCDEPTGNLDDFTSASIHELLGRLRKEWKLTQIIATHDKEFARRADKTLRIEGGKLLETSDI